VTRGRAAETALDSKLDMKKHSFTYLKTPWIL